MTSSTNSPQQPEPALGLGTLQALFISKLQFSVDSDPASDEPTLKADINVFVQRSSDPGERQISVRLKLVPAKGATAPYEMDIEAFAIINGFAAEANAERLDKHAVAVAAPLAFNTIREQILNLTARGPHSKVILPMINLKVLVNEFKLIDPVVEG